MLQTWHLLKLTQLGFLMQAPDFSDLLTCPSLAENLMPLLPAFQLLIKPCTAKGSAGHLKREPHSLSAAICIAVHTSH